MPLPPYIKRPAEGAGGGSGDSYQTLFAARDGAVAAPYSLPAFHAGAGGSDPRRAAWRSCTVTLHVGAGTFLPVKVDDLSQST